MPINSLIVIASEIALALYPILIKTVPTDIGTQLVARLLTYSVLGFSLASPGDIRQTWGTGAGLTRSFSLGLMTLVHVFTSYLAFQQLPAGVSMSLFYSYPIFILVGASLFFGESFGPLQMILVTVAFFGVVLVSMSVKEEDDGTSKEKISANTLNWTGVLAGLAAALTEAGMYFAVRTAKQPNPFYAVLELYPAALPLLLLGLFVTGHRVDLRPEVWKPMLLFNTVIGFVGYCLRFYAIPRLPTLVFSLLSFIGVVASFVWGWVFVKEVPSWLSVVGGGLIAAAAGGAKIA